MGVRKRRLTAKNGLQDSILRNRDEGQALPEKEIHKGGGGGVGVGGGGGGGGETPLKKWEKSQDSTAEFRPVRRN